MFADDKIEKDRIRARREQIRRERERNEQLLVAKATEEGYHQLFRDILGLLDYRHSRFVRWGVRQAKAEVSFHYRFPDDTVPFYMSWGNRYAGVTVYLNGENFDDLSLSDLLYEEEFLSKIKNTLGRRYRVGKPDYPL